MKSKFIPLLLGAVCVWLHAVAAAAADAQPQRPNFLFIYTDDQRWDAMSVVQREQGERGCFPWLETPHMDRLAAEGVRFRNAFVTLALCAPSRAAFLTGRYNHANGVANNRTPFPPDSITHATLLRAAGYATGYVGKWHMGSQRGQRAGFDYSASFIGQGKYVDCPVEINGVSTPTTGWVDDVSTDYAVDFIKKNKDKPWSLIVGFKTAHGPFTPPERAKNRFAGAVARPVPNLGVRAIYNPDAKPRQDNKNAAAGAGPRPFNLNYFRCVSAVDDNLGRLLAALDELGLSENTVVIFTSDNGFYLGEHGLADKRSAYEESIRIPLLVRYPRLGVRGKVVDEMALNTDLAPTLLDLAGLPVPKEMHGRSWRPLLEGKPAEWRKAWLYEYFKEGNYSTPTVFAVRTESAKLIKYPGHDEWTEVFDLKTDPFETKNVASDPAHKELRELLEVEFERQAKAVDFRIPDYADKAEAEPAPGKRANVFVLEYDFSKDQGARVIDASGHKNHGTANAAPIVESRDGKKARRFDGKGTIEVPKAPSLDPSGGPWSVEVVVRAQQPNGVVIARGGRTNGYSLYLDEGRPVFAVAANSGGSSVAAQETITGQWTQLAAVITADQRLALYVNGALAATTPLHAFIGRDPRDAMQIGGDRASQVTDYKGSSNFAGEVESVRIFSGEWKPARAPGEERK